MSVWEKDTTKDDRNAVLLTYVNILLLTWKHRYGHNGVYTTYVNIGDESGDTSWLLLKFINWNGGDHLRKKLLEWIKTHKISINNQFDSFEVFLYFYLIEKNYFDILFILIQKKKTSEIIKFFVIDNILIKWFWFLTSMHGT